jgi:LysR family transcriptional regulator, hydrogen peroxide-inducible genes activator
MMAISIRKLRYLEAVGRFGHFGKAAAHCAVSQPALSMQMQELERDLGIPLIERRSKGVRLTDAGAEICRRAGSILAQVRDIADFAHSQSEILSSALRLGVIPTVAPYLLPALMRLLSEHYPKLDLKVRETTTQQLTEEMLDGTLDVILLALPVLHGEIETLPIRDDTFFLAMPKGREMKGRVIATSDLIRNDRLLLLEEGHCLRDQALAFCNLRPAEGVDTFGASSLSTIVQMVSHGMGLTFLPEISLEVETSRTAIHVMRFADPEPKRSLGLAWRVTSPRKADYRALATVMAEAFPPRMDHPQ